MTHPDIELLNTVYPSVPAVDLPKSGGGLARFVDADDYLPLSGGTITGDLDVDGDVSFGGDVTIAEQSAWRNALGCNPVSYTPTWSEYGTPPHWHCKVSNGICHFMYQGPSSATPTNTLLCTFPAACRPLVQTWIPFVKGGGASGIAYINESDGKLIVNQISSTTNAARLIIDASWPVA